MLTRLLVLAVVLLLPSSVALADTGDPVSATSSSAFDHRHIGAEMMLGLMTPLGEAGASLVVSPHPIVDLELGYGAGMSGGQAAAMVRLSPIRGQFGLSVGLGASTGNYEWGWGLYTYDTTRWSPARWGNGEVGAHVTWSQVQLRAFVGYSRQLSPGKHCRVTHHSYSDSGGSSETRACDDDEGGDSLPYGGVALRFATRLGE